MTEMEVKAYHIAAVLENVLVNYLPYPGKQRTVEPENKEKIRTALELTGKEEAANVMRRCYSRSHTHGQAYGAALTVGNDTVLIHDGGLTVQDVSLNWSELVEIVKGLIVSNRYMTSSELSNYAEIRHASQELLESSFEKMVKNSNWEARKTAIVKYGEKACTELWNDPEPKVRFCVAKKTHSDYLRAKMIHDPDPLVRESLAECGGESIRQMLLNLEETEPNVLMSICKYGNDKTQAQLIALLDFDADRLVPYAPHFSQNLKQVLLLDDNPHLAVLGLSEATMEQCKKLYDHPELKADEKFLVYSRMAEMEQSEASEPERESLSEATSPEQEDIPLPDDSFAPPDVPDPSR